MTAFVAGDGCSPALRAFSSARRSRSDFCISAFRRADWSSAGSSCPPNGSARFLWFVGIRRGAGRLPSAAELSETVYAAQAKPQASAAAPRVLSLEIVMVLSTPLASEVTVAEAEAASVARPPANPRDTQTVALSRPAGNAAVARGVGPVASRGAGRCQAAAD